jgi:large conductance mechanosensitive channel
MFKEFRAFILRGNVLDLAIAVVIGAAFGGVVKSLVDDVVMPPIGLAVGRVDFSNLYVLLQEGMKAPAPYASLAEAKEAGAVTLNYGMFLNSIFGFLIVAAAIFTIVKAANRLYRVPAPPPPNTKDCPFCRNAIPLAAIRCGHCTSQLDGGVASVAPAGLSPVR